MRILATLFCVCTMATTSMPPASAATPETESRTEPSTVELLRDLDALFMLQDASARGRQDAAALQKSLLRSIGERLSRNNVQNPNQISPSVAAFVLSGGNPGIAAKLAKSQDLLPSHRRLLEGVAFFMEGSREEAEQLLRGIDLSTLPRRISGRVALAQSLLERDPQVRQSKLSTAMALMPGTLVEESALRRSALAFAESTDERNFWKRLARHQRRYPDSLYARAFWEEITSQLSSWTSRGQRPDLIQLDLVIMDQPVSRRRQLYLSLARKSARNNDVMSVEFAAARARRLAVEGSPEEHTARLYRSLFSVVSEDGQRSFSELKSLRRDLLEPGDRALLDAGLWIAEQIGRPVAPGRSAAAEDFAEATEIQRRAEEVMVEVEKLLAEGGF